MFVRTKTKLLFASLLQRMVMAVLQVGGKSSIVTTRRSGVSWRLNLEEGIDFTIFVLGVFEPSTVAAYRRLLKEGSIVIDVGANIGAHTLPLASIVGRSGLVIAVEPTAYAFDRLKEQISLNLDLALQIRPVQAMLMGSESAPVVDALPSSWPLIRSAQGHELHLGVGKSTAGAHVTTLDALVAESKVPTVDFIKLDVDGYEVEVLRGGTDVLKRFGPSIIFEHSPYTLQEKGYDTRDLIKILRDFDYHLSNVTGVPFGDGTTVPDVPPGASINVLARRKKA